MFLKVFLSIFVITAVTPVWACADEAPTGFLVILFGVLCIWHLVPTIIVSACGVKGNKKSWVFGSLIIAFIAWIQVFLVGEIANQPNLAVVLFIATPIIFLLFFSQLRGKSKTMEKGGVNV